MKRTLFNIDESEKQRILEMHVSEGKKHLSEQSTGVPVTKPIVQPKQANSQSFSTTELIANTKGDIFKDEKPIAWSITPSVGQMKDSSGKIVANPSKLNLVIKPDSLPNTSVRLEIDCNTNEVSFIGSSTTDDFSNLTFKYMGREYTGNDGPNSAKNLITQSINDPNRKGKWKYDGPIKVMADKFCKTA